MNHPVFGIEFNFEIFFSFDEMPREWHAVSAGQTGLRTYLFALCVPQRFFCKCEPSGFEIALQFTIFSPVRSKFEYNAALRRIRRRTVGHAVSAGQTGPQVGQTQGTEERRKAAREARL